MIRVVSGRECLCYSTDMNEMFRARAEIFGRRMGWSVLIDRDGLEVDEFDRLYSPTYLLSIDDRGVLRGSLRLLPTAGPTMLRNCFSEMFNDDVDVMSGTVWECTRFCVHPVAVDGGAAGGLVSTELLLGICELGLKYGLTQITGVYEQRMVRIYRRIGWSPARLASNTDGTIDVGLWDVEEAALAQMRARSGIQHSVLIEDDANISAVA